MAQPRLRLILFDQGEGKGKLDKTIGLKTVRISSREAMKDSYMHHDSSTTSSIGNQNLRYLPRQVSENDPHNELASIRVVGLISHCPCALASSSV
jgi:hypothetical protein